MIIPTINSSLQSQITHTVACIDFQQVPKNCPGFALHEQQKLQRTTCFKPDKHFFTLQYINIPYTTRGV